MFHERYKPFCIREADLIALNLRQANGLLPLAVFVQVEIEIIGEDDCVERSFVAVELLAIFLSSVEVSVFEVFCFDIGNRQLLAEQGQIRCTAINMALLIDDSTSSAILQETLECRTERVFGGQTSLVQLINLLDIRGDKFVHGSVHFTRLVYLDE